MNDMALEMIHLGACAIYSGLRDQKYESCEAVRLSVTISRRIWKETLRALKEEDV